MVVEKERMAEVEHDVHLLAELNELRSTDGVIGFGDRGRCRVENRFGDSQVERAIF